MKRAMLIVVMAMGACTTPAADPPNHLCRVGRDCPDAGVMSNDADSPPLCDGHVPAFPPCTCGVWVCIDVNGRVQQQNVCGPQCDAGVNAH